MPIIEDVNVSAYERGSKDALASIASTTPPRFPSYEWTSG